LAHLVRKKQDDGLKALFASIHVVAQEEIIALLGVPLIQEQSHAACIKAESEGTSYYTTVDPKQWVDSRRVEEQGQTHDMRKH
jgi:hypothetical protein